MGGDPVGRGLEKQALRAVFERARVESAGVVLYGEAGIGKTTLCRATATMAGEDGFAVLTTTGSAAEMSMAWAGLADLLAGIDESVIAGLSPLHQQALRAVGTGLDAPGGDERLVAAAFRAALDGQSRQRPVAVIVDDAQWLDEPSKLVVAFAVRRLPSRLAVVIAFRGGESGGEDPPWVRMADPQALSRMTLGPMSREELRTMIDARLGHIPEAATMTRIHSLSGGHPLYALELARAAGEHPGRDLGELPPSLAGLVRERIGAVDDRTKQALVVAAAAFEPTVEVVAAAVGCGSDELVDMLQPLESRGVLVFDGPRIRFSHPLLASGVTGGVDPAARRLAHRRLAGAVASPEQRARHLASSTPQGDPETLAALDAAAEAAAARGAYSTAAQLLSLCIDRGGDVEFRRLRAADFHFRAGSLDDAETLLMPALEDLSPGFVRTAALMLVAAISGYREGLAGTTDLLRRAVEEAGDDLMLRAQAQLLLSTATGIGGDMASSVQLAGQARADAAATGLPQLHSQALAVWVSASIIHGLGMDSEAMREALDLGDPDVTAPVMFRPTTVQAQTCAWTGQLVDAHAMMTEVALRCAERGNELDVVWADEQLTMINVALGRYDDAERTATDALQRAEQIGGRLPLINAYTAAATVAAYRGRLEDTRVAARAAVAAATAAQMHYVTRPPLMSLAFVQVSDGRYDEALQTLAPLLESFDPDHGTEIMVGGYLPDAVEALVALGRAEEAEPLVAALEVNGARHDRPWMLAVGARCRALLAADERDLDAALTSAEEAMAHHDRLPMPFERARTELLVGQLQRRRRRTQAAQASLSRAAEVFDEIGSPLWSARAHRELQRLPTRSAGAALTDSERQVAEHAASGLTNKEIAATVYLSTKTVEMHLSNAYRKLGVRSRTQLAARLRG